MRVLRRGMVETNSLVAWQYNPADRTERRALDDLRAQIEKDGIIYPIMVARDGVTVGDGHRRLAIAKELGIPKVYVHVLDASPEEIFSANAGQKSPSGKNWLAVNVKTNGRTAIPQRLRSDMEQIKRIAGEDALHLLAERNIAPGVWKSVNRTCAYVRRDSDDAKRKVFYWIVNRRQQFMVRRAIDGRINPDLLWRAIEDDKELEYTFNLVERQNDAPR